MSHCHMRLVWNGILHKSLATPFVGVAFFWISVLLGFVVQKYYNISGNPLR